MTLIELCTALGMFLGILIGAVWAFTSESRWAGYGPYLGIALGPIVMFLMLLLVMFGDWGMQASRDWLRSLRGKQQ